MRRTSAIALGAMLLLKAVLLIQGAKQAEVNHIQEAAISVEASEMSHMLAAAQQLVQDLQQDGAQINVDIRQVPSQAGLGIFAQADTKAGDILLAVPVERGFSALGVNGILDFLLEFTLDLFNPGSPRATMYATMPPPHKLRHQLNFPQQYLPLLQHKDLEARLGDGLHSEFKAFYEMHKDVLTAANISYDDVIHALGLLGTRTISQPTPDGKASIFYTLPLLDLAQHDNHCPHYNTIKPCDWDEARQCAYLTAGAAIKAGKEVCSWFGYLLPDRAFLEFGLLPQAPAAGPGGKKQKAKKVKKPSEQPTGDAATATTAEASADAAPKRSSKAARKSKAAEAQLPPLPLFGIDRHDYDATTPLVKLDEEPMPFMGVPTGDLTSLSTRISQLQQLHDTLKSGDALAAEVAAQGPAPGDADGAFLKQVLDWRLQRQRAVVAEVERLEKIKTVVKIRTAINNAAKTKKQRR